MRLRRSNRTVVITAREVTILVLALAFLSLAALAFVLGLTRLGPRQPAAPTIAVAAATQPAQPTRPPATTGPTPTIDAGPTASPTPGQFEHTVQPGESLTSIAIFYGITLSDLLRVNGLGVDGTVRDGQILVIPLPPSLKGTWHVVEQGETLTIIANRYGVPPDVIQAANYLSDANAIITGQRLRIPLTAPPESAAQLTPAATAISTLTAPVTPVDTSDIPRRIVRSQWPRSLLEGDLDANYPLTYTDERFTIHYQPGTYADQNLDETVGIVREALSIIEARLDVSLPGTFDVYIAGTLFAAPNAHLHGLSRSAERKVFVLHDGSGTPVDNRYFFLHEMAHMVAWNTWGSPSSTMLSEGVATYAGQAVLEDGGYLPYTQLCTASYSAGLIPSMAAIERDWQAFMGHIRHPINYFGSACFVGYLVETYGLEALGRLYHTSDYTGTYGVPLTELDAAWQAALAAEQADLRIAPADLAAYTEEVGTAFEFVLNNYNGTDVMYNAYAAVDQARVALWQGNYPEARKWLDKVYAVVGYHP
jgi:LysM repeat protein